MPLDEELRPPVSVSPAGREGSGIAMFWAALSRPEARPLLLTRCRLILLGPALWTCQVADSDTRPPARLRLPLISLLPTELIFSACLPPPRKDASGPASDRALPMAPRLMRRVPFSGPAVPPMKLEFRCTLEAMTLSFVIVIGPSAMLPELIVI